MTFKKLAPSLFAAGYSVLPAKGKRVLESGWQEIAITAEKVTYWATNGQANNNVGIRTGDTSVCGMALTMADVDIYDKDVARVVAASIEETFGSTVERRGQAPKRGLIYVQSKSFPKVQRVFVSPDGVEHKVEWLGKGQQFVGYGIHPDTNKPYGWRDDRGLLEVEPWELPEVTFDAVDRWMRETLPTLVPESWTCSDVHASESQAGLSADERALLNFKAKVDVSREYLRGATMLLDPNMPYDQWLKVAMALHHQSDGAEWGFDIFNEWSAKGDEYKQREVEQKWRSTKNDGSRGPIVTAATILKWARESAGWATFEKETQVKSAKTHQDAITSAQDEITLRDIAQRISVDGAVDRVAKDMLAEALREQFAKVGNGKKPSIAAVRDLLGMGKRKRVVETSENGPEWLQGWCYVTAQAKFFNVGTKEVINKEAFDAAFCRLLPLDENGNVSSAAKLACDIWQIPAVYNLMYLPSANDFFSINGQEYANLYRPESVPAPLPAGVLEEGENVAAMRVLMRHVELVIPNETYRTAFLRWAAWIVRNPGKKVLWAVFIKGVEGDGKSVLGNMMAVAMGYENVGIISPETLSGSNFNDWAVGRCLNVVEEMKMVGHNRHDVYNKIKPLITNPRIELHGKGKAAMTAVNTCNYIGFSNHVDALPLDMHDRRQLVLFTPWGTIASLHDHISKLGLTVDTYWEQMWDVVKNRPDVVRSFFESIDIEGFNPNGRAPDTHFKRAMVAVEISDEEASARELIEAGAVGIGKKVISSSCLTNQLLMSDPPVVLQTTQVKKLLLKLGYAPFEKQVKWNGWPHRVWVHSEVTSAVTSEVTSLTVDMVREMLNETGVEF